MADVIDQRPKAERRHWIERVDDPGDGSIEIRLVEILHDGAGNRLAEGTMGVQFTIKRNGIHAVHILPMNVASTDIADTIKAWDAGDRDRATFEEIASVSKAFGNPWGRGRQWRA